VALLKTDLNWQIETDVVTPDVAIVMVQTVLYSGIWRIVVDSYTSCFRRYLLCPSSDREVKVGYSFETVVTLNQNAMRHISGGTDLEELHILMF
jgi:hypothetical protein